MPVLPLVLTDLFTGFFSSYLTGFGLFSFEKEYSESYMTCSEQVKMNHVERKKRGGGREGVEGFSYFSFVYIEFIF